MKKLLVLLFFAVVSSTLSLDAQCPMCKTALKSSQKNTAQTNTYGRGINKGILFLMAFPYVLGAVGGVVWYKHRRKKKSLLNH